MLKKKLNLRAYLSLAIVMLLLVGAFFAFAVTGSANDEATPAAEKTEINVWLIGGQSNAVGYANDLTAEQAADNRYFEGFDNVLYYGYSERRVSEIEGVMFGQGQKLNKAGAEIGIAESLGDSGTMNIVIKYAQGATYLYPNTSSSYSQTYGTWTSPTYIKNHSIDTAGTKTGLLYTNFISTIEDTCRQLDEMGYKPVVRGMWWMQGEAECGNETEASAYAELLETLINDVRQDVGKITGEDLSKMPFAFGKIYRNPTTTIPKYLSVVTDCQARVAAKADFNAFLVDPTECAGLGQHDSWHFNAATQTFFGQQLVEKTLNTLGLSKVDVTGTNVRLSGGGFHKAGDTVTVQLTAPEGYIITGVKMSVGGGAATSINLTNGKYTFTSEGKDVVFTATTSGTAEKTPYGDIPAEYNVENYPFAIFTDSFVGAYTYWGGAMNAAKNILYGANGAGKSATIYMRRDYASGAKDATNGIVTHLNGALTVDFGNNTFTRTSRGYFLDVVASVTDGALFTTTVNTKNGTLVYTGSTFIGLNHSDSSALNGVLKTISLGFDNVTFTVAEGSSSSAGVGIITSCWENQNIGVNVDLDFVNCTFDLTNAPAGTEVLNFSGSGKTLTKVDAEIKGGTVILGNNSVKFAVVDALDKVTYKTNSSYEYISLKAPAGTSNSAFNDYYSNGVEGELVKFELAKTEGGYDYYVINVINDEVSESTAYGLIPSSYLSKLDYPFVIFKTDRTFIGGYAELGAAMNAMKIASKTDDFVILMRRDAEKTTVTNDKTGGNLDVYKGNLTIDLGGFNLTLTATGKYLFDISVQDNSSAALTNGFDVRANYTLLNGTITKAAGNMLICMNYGKAFKNDAKFSFTFKDITFISKVANANFITGTWENNGTDVTSGGNPKLVTDILLENCTFDYKNSASGITMFGMNATNKLDRIVYNVTLKGGKIVSDKAISVNNIYTANDNTNGRADSFSFAADENGNYTILELAEGINPPTAYFNGDTLTFKKDSEADGIVTYKLGAPDVVLTPEKTLYGDIPVAYLDKAANPIVMFKGDKTFVGAYSDFGNATAKMKDAPAEDYVVLLRANALCNVKTGDHYKLTGNITVDLNGFELTLTSTGKYFFDIYVAGNGTEGTDVRATYNFKNGTINTPKQLFCVNYGGIKRDMEVYFNFDNVTFIATGSGNVMFQTWENGYVDGSISLSTDISQTTYATFNNCTFDLEKSHTNALFFDATSGSGDISVFNITINGGKIIAKSASSMQNFIKFNGNGNGRADSLRFGTNENGEYTKLILPAGEAAPATAIKNLLDGSMYILYSTEEIDLAFVITTSGAENDEYVLMVNCKDGDGDHKCDVCDSVLSQCADDDRDHDCDVCGASLSSCADIDNDHECEYCKKVITECADDNNDHKCDVCGKTLSGCADDNNDHKCDVCESRLSNCKDEDRNHACDVCGAQNVCVDENNDHDCDLCGKENITDCADNDKNHKCDVCDKALSDCADDNNDHDCDLCGKENITDCADEDKNHKCDVCDKVLSDCADDDNDHDCDVCGVKMSDCADNDKDHGCDVCGKALSECDDKNKDHKCEFCGKTISECTDGNNDHNCDICKAKISSCADVTDKDHNCDLCGKTISECEDANNDHKCDVCGIVGICADIDGDGKCDVCENDMPSVDGEEENKTFFASIADWFKSIIEKIKEAFSSLIGGNKANKE